MDILRTGDDMFITLKKYTGIWLTFAKYELLNQFSTKTSMVFFFIGKVIRFLSFFVILLLLKNNTKSIAGYTVDEALIFYLTFNFIDVVTQMFLRGVYMLSGKVRSGEFDFFLTKPISPLFRSLAGSPDFNDVLLFIPLTIFSAWYIAAAVPNLTLLHMMLYLLLLTNGLLISLAFHIFVLCVGIVSTEVDNTIMLYRDLSKMGQFPMEIYREPLRGIITFVIPVGIMMSVPAKVLLGLSSGPLIGVAIGIGILTLLLSLIAWDQALKRYTSASS